MNVEKPNNKIKNIIDNSMKNLIDSIDVNIIMGKPIQFETGEVIVPVSRVVFGILSGGGEYGKNTIFTKNSLPFSAGNGSVVSVKPCGFLIKENVTSSYKFITVNESNYEKLVDKTSDFFANLMVNE